MPQTNAPSLVDHEARIAVLERADRDHTETLKEISAKMDKIQLWLIGSLLTMLAHMGGQWLGFFK